MKRRLICVALALACCFFAASCAAKSNSGSTKSPQTYGNGAVGEAADTAKESENESAGDGQTETDVGNTDLDARKLIKNAEMGIETQSFDDFMTELQQQIKSCGGYVEQSRVSGNSYTSTAMRSANVTARIPADQLDAFTAQVSTLGIVTSKSEDVKDVTMDYVDMESRIKSLRTEQDSLLKLLESAKDLDTILKIQSRLTEVRSDLESYEAKIRKYDNLVAYSTVTMNIREVKRVTEPGEQGMWQQIGTNLSNNLYDIGQALRGLFVWLVSALPYLLLIALIVGVIVVIVRVSTRRRRKKIQDNWPEPPTPPTQQ